MRRPGRTAKQRGGARRRVWVTCAVAAGALWTGWGGVLVDGVWLETREPDRTTLASMHGRAAPPLHVEGWVNGGPLRLEDLRGKVVLLDFWGSWCGPCRKLTPVLIDLHERYRERGLVIIGIHTSEGAGQMGRYVREAKIPYPVAVDVGRATRELYRVDGYPDVYLIDRRGVVRYADVDQSKPGNLEAAVRKLLGEERPVPTTAPGGG